MNILAIDALHFSYDHFKVNNRSIDEMKQYIANLEVYNFDNIVLVWDTFSFGLMNNRDIVLDKGDIGFIQNSEIKGKAKVLGKSLIKSVMLNVPSASMIFSSSSAIQGMKYLCDTVSENCDLYIHMDDTRFYQFSRFKNVSILDSKGIFDYNGCSSEVGMPIVNLPIYQAFAGDLSCLLPPLKNDVSFSGMKKLLSEVEFSSRSLTARSFLDSPLNNVNLLGGLLSRCQLENQLQKTSLHQKEIAERVYFLTGGGVNIREDSIYYS